MIMLELYSRWKWKFKLPKYCSSQDFLQAFPPLGTKMCRHLACFILLKAGAAANFFHQEHNAISSSL